MDRKGREGSSFVRSLLLSFGHLCAWLGSSLIPRTQKKEDSRNCNYVRIFFFLSFLDYLALWGFLIDKLVMMNGMEKGLF